MLGTPDFIAPEQIRNARDADIRADIHSLGCTLYYLLTGGPPFRGASLYDILQAHHSMDARPLNMARPEVPVELAALVAKWTREGSRSSGPEAISPSATSVAKRRAWPRSMRWRRVGANGKARSLGGFDSPRPTGRNWYTALVKVNGGRLECSLLDGNREVARKSFNNQSQWHGKVGLGTKNSSFRFRNIKSTCFPRSNWLWNMEDRRALPQDKGFHHWRRSSVGGRIA
jgi:serine/threonine protein kinase